MIATDFEGRITYWNRHAEQIYGWRAEEVIGRNLVDVIVSPTVAVDAARILAALSAGDTWSGEYLVRHRNGSEFVALVTSSPIRDDDGKIVGMIGVSVEASRMRSASDLLHAAHARQEALLSAVPDMIFRIGADHTYRDFRGATDELLVEPAVFIGRKIEDILPPEPARLCITAVEDAIREQRVVGIDFALPIRGELRSFHTRIAPIGTTEVVAVTRDVTDRRLARRLIEAQEEERRRIGRELHDEIGQILTGVNLMLARADVEPELVRTAQEILAGLLDRVRDLSLLLRPPMLDTGLVPALRWHLERFRAQSGINVAMHTTAVPRLRTEVETAAYRIVQEALTNVARHAGARRATVSVRIEGERLSVEIADDGRGFDPDGECEGMGLESMRQRAALVGGRLRIASSAPGSGTLVAAELPLRTAGEP